MDIPLETASAELEIEKSRFLAASSIVETEEAAQEIIKTVRAEHPKSRHVVWAYVIGDEKRQYLGMSDDGEPKGTAGRPALAALQYSGLTNILVTVVRYFGGVKLGTGGLVRAYTDAVKAVIDDLPRKKLVEEIKLELRFGYSLYDMLKKVIYDHQGKIESESFTTEIALVCSIERKAANNLKKVCMETAQGRISIFTP